MDPLNVVTHVRYVAFISLETFFQEYQKASKGQMILKFYSAKKNGKNLIIQTSKRWNEKNFQLPFFHSFFGEKIKHFELLTKNIYM